MNNKSYIKNNKIKSNGKLNYKLLVQEIKRRYPKILSHLANN